MTAPLDPLEREPESGLCAHCGLPLFAPRWGRQHAATGPEYCCFGCRFAAAVIRERGELGVAQGTLTRLGLAIFFTMNVMAFTMALWTGDVYQAGPGGAGAGALNASLESVFRHLVMLFALPVGLLLGGPLLDNALQGVRRGIFSTDLLVAAGVGAAFVLSALSVLRGSGPVYFEVGCVVLVMVTLGRWLEATGKIKANDALERLERLLPREVRRLSADGDIAESTPLDMIRGGDRLRVLAGERFPADGRLERGRALVDEQVLTGESTPVLKEARDGILGGTLNLDGDLVVEVTATGSAGTLARLIAMVRQARTTKGSYERLADRVSAWAVPVLAVIALTTFAGHAWTGGLERGVLQGLAVVLIACPCALGLATPLAIATALGRAAGEQVLVRSAERFERLATIRAIRFDKTGTLTTGTPSVAAFVAEDGPGSVGEAVVVQHHAAALGAASSHVLSRAIVRFVGAEMASQSERDDQPEDVSRLGAVEVRAIAGLGVVGRVGEPPLTASLGSRRLMEEQGLALGPQLDAAARAAEVQGRTYALIGWEGRARGLFVIAEELRPSARPALTRCRGLGLDLGVLTGDHAARGRALAAELAVPVEAGLLPEEKVAAVRRARGALGPVAMVGDGVNDAPALAASDLGVALGCGTDLARDSAGLCLLGDDLTRLPWAIGLARRTVAVIRENLAWAFGYNTIGVLAAALGWLSPALAAVLMVGSSLLVIANSLRLRREVPPPPYDTLSPNPTARESVACPPQRSVRGCSLSAALAEAPVA